MSDAQHVQFTGSIPANFDRYLGPVLFEPFARDLARRLPTHDGVRVLAPGGRVLYSSWGPFANNAFGRIIDELLQAMFPEDPPTFYRTPFSDHDPVELRLADALRRALGDRPVRVHLQSWLVTATT